MFGQDALTGVSNGNDIPVIPTLVSYGNGSGPPVKFNGVVDQVCQHLFEPCRVGRDNGAGSDLILKHDLACRCLCRKICQDITGQISEFHVADLDRHCARFDQRKLKNIGYQAVHPLGVAADHIEKMPVIFFVVDAAVLERFDKRQDRCQRRPQLVRNV